METTTTKECPCCSLLETRLDALKELMLKEVDHLEEMSRQHDKFTQQAIEKSERESNERFAKTNEFRQAMEDVVATRSSKDEMQSMRDKFEQNMDSVTKRYESGIGMQSSKIDVLGKNLEEKIESNIRVQDQKFSATDIQMQTLIDTNAQISNTGLKELNKWKDTQTGSMKVVERIISFLVAIVLGLIIFYWTHR